MRLPVRLLAGLLVWAALSPPRLYAETGHDAWLRYAALTPAARPRPISRPLSPCSNRLPPSPVHATNWCAACAACSREGARLGGASPLRGAIVIGTLGSASPVGAHACTGRRPCAGRVPDQRLSARDGGRYLVIAGESDRAVLVRRVRAAAQDRRRAAAREPRRDARRRTRRCAGSTSGTTSTARSSAATAADRSSGTTAGSAPTSRAVSDYGAAARVDRHQRHLDQQRQRRTGSSSRRSSCRRSRASPTCCGRGASGSRWRSTSAARSTLGGLPTYDPLDPAVVAWWKRPRRRALRRDPGFAGFVLKADSEGRVGPSTYGRTHADAANVVARALAPHGGVIFYRGFVYDHHMDWNNPKNDRARAAYDNFQPLDGAVRRQRHHPDQARPDRLPGARAGVAALRRARRKRTRRSSCRSRRSTWARGGTPSSSSPMWKEALDFDMQVRGDGTPVKALVGRQHVPPARRADSSASRTSASTTTGSAITCRRRTSTASAGWRGIPT